MEGGAMYARGGGLSIESAPLQIRYFGEGEPAGGPGVTLQSETITAARRFLAKIPRQSPSGPLN